MQDKLSQLKAMTVVVADTGDVDSIRAFQPTDCTTNPSLILNAAKMSAYSTLVDEAVAWARQQSGTRSAVLAATCDRISVNFGEVLSKIVPGRVSTEVDADLSFDVAAMLNKGRSLIAEYEKRGIDRSRILIKLAATWEGIKAAEILEREKINCNLTLLFSFAQAQACAQAGVFLISPFVGRILDWHSKSTGQSYSLQSDPGVLSVTRIFHHFKAQGYATVVMGASFRNLGQVEALAGCDRLTIAPRLLDQLANDNGILTRRLNGDDVENMVRETGISEALFRYSHNEDAMAHEKLGEGIRQFASDLKALKTMVELRLDRKTTS